MTDKVDEFRKSIGLAPRPRVDPESVKPVDPPPPGFNDIQFGVKADGRWVVLTLGTFGTLRLEPANALDLGRALKSCALRVRAQRKV